MPTLTIELPSHADQVEFNLRRWTEVMADRELAKIEGRIETDRHGYIIMSPPPGADHGGYQFKIGVLLHTCMKDGRVLTECPISTADGVRAADVVWASTECNRARGNYQVFPKCPEICVEVRSPGNTQAEINEKVALYFDAGAHEVWICNLKGKMIFLGRKSIKPLPHSKLCPGFPGKVVLQD